jgi:hypothetical protein
MFGVFIDLVMVILRLSAALVLSITSILSQGTLLAENQSLIGLVSAGNTY